MSGHTSFSAGECHHFIIFRTGHIPWEISPSKNVEAAVPAAAGVVHLPARRCHPELPEIPSARNAYQRVRSWSTYPVVGRDRSIRSHGNPYSISSLSHDGSMYDIIMVTWPPSTKNPNFVSINLPYIHGSVMGMKWGAVRSYFKFPNQMIVTTFF